MDSFDLCGSVPCLVSRLQLCFPYSAILSGCGFCFLSLCEQIAGLRPVFISPVQRIILSTPPRSFTSIPIPFLLGEITHPLPSAFEVALWLSNQIEVVHTDIRGCSKPSSREVEMIPALGTSKRHSYEDRVGDWFLEKKWQGRNDWGLKKTESLLGEAGKDSEPDLWMMWWQATLQAL